MITVLMGVSGVGKSSWLASQTGIGTRITFDAIRKRGVPVGPMIAATRKRARRLAAEGVPLVGDACNLRREHRSWWLNLADESDVDTRLVAFHPPTLEELLSRQAVRGDAAIPQDVLKRQLREWPSAWSVARREPWGSVVEVGSAVVTSRSW